MRENLALLKRGVLKCIVSTSTLATGANVEGVDHACVQADRNSAVYELAQEIGRCGRFRPGFCIIHGAACISARVTSMTSFANRLKRAKASSTTTALDREVRRRGWRTGTTTGCLTCAGTAYVIVKNDERRLRIRYFPDRPEESHYSQAIGYFLSANLSVVSLHLAHSVYTAGPPGITSSVVASELLRSLERELHPCRPRPPFRIRASTF
jgi:hypothetical protein